MTEILLRFLIGGVVVGAFAMLGDMLRPKSFAGLFGAAPSVALATLGLTIVHDGRAYASIEARSMIAGAVAFFIYSWCVSRALIRYKRSVVSTTVLLLPAWFACALAIWSVWLRR